MVNTDLIYTQLLLLKGRNKKDSFQKFKMIIQSSIDNSFRKKGFLKEEKTLFILGCSYAEFKAHVERQFQPWMSWDNAGLYNGELNYGWDLDHIVPIASAKTKEDIILLNHYTNFQPLCSFTNRYIKGDKLNFISENKER